MKARLLTVDHPATNNLPPQGIGFLMVTVSFELVEGESSMGAQLPADVKLMGWPVVAMPFSAARPNTWVGQVLLSGTKSVIQRACGQFTPGGNADIQ